MSVICFFHRLSRKRQNRIAHVTGLILIFSVAVMLTYIVQSSDIPAFTPLKIFVENVSRMPATLQVTEDSGMKYVCI